MRDLTKLLELPEEEEEKEVKDCQCPASWFQKEYDAEYEDFKIKFLNSGIKQKLIEKYLALHLKDYA